MTDLDIVKVTVQDGITIVSFNTACLTTGIALDAAAAKISELITQSKPKKMIVDFGGVKFFSSQTLGVLLDVRKRLASFGGKIVISGINPQLYRVFRITNLDKIFSFFPDVSSAAAELNG